jgi:hypothetical protein
VNHTIVDKVFLIVRLEIKVLHHHASLLRHVHTRAVTMTRVTVTAATAAPALGRARGFGHGEHVPLWWRVRQWHFEHEVGRRVEHDQLPVPILTVFASEQLAVRQVA